MSSEYLNSQYKNKIEYTSTVASSTSVGSEENSDASIMANNSNATANYVLSSSDLKEDDIELIKKELERKIQEQKENLENDKDTRGVFTSAWKSVSGFFGGGDKKAENSIADSEKLLAGLDSDISNINEVYKTIMGSDLDVNALSALKASQNISKQIDSETQKAIVAELENQIAVLESNFETAKNSNGWISGTWDKLKNWSGIGASSNKTLAEITDLKEQIEKLKNGEADLATTYKNITGADLNYDNLNSLLSGENGTGLDSISTAGQSVDSYSQGQKMSVDIVGDIVSGVTSVGVVAIGSVLGICAAPFTAGASLGLVAAGIGMAAGTGAVVKSTIKASDCLGNEKEYSLKDFGYDVVTGSLNGAMGPVSNGAGGAVGTGIMKICGMEALETTAKTTLKVAGREIVEETAEAVAKNTGKTLLQKGVGIFAKGFDMAVDGAISGATDGFSRAAAEGRWEDIGQDTFNGGLGGLIASPIISTGFNAAGKLGGELGQTVAGRAIKKATSETLEESANLISKITHEFAPSLAKNLDDFGNLINDRIATTAINKAIVKNSDDSLTVTIGQNVINVAKDEIPEEIAGDNAKIYSWLVKGMQEYEVNLRAQEYYNYAKDLDIGDDLSEKISKLTPEQFNQVAGLLDFGYEPIQAYQIGRLPAEQMQSAIELIDMGIPPSKAADTAVLMNSQGDRIMNLIQNPNVNNYYVADLANLSEAEYIAATYAIEQGVSAPSAISNAKKLTSAQDIDAQIAMIKSGKMKREITPEVEKSLNEMAQKLSDEYQANAAASESDYLSMLLEEGENITDDYEKLSSRVKGRESALAKLKSKYESGQIQLTGDFEADIELAKTKLTDAYGARLQMKSLTSDDVADILKQNGLTHLDAQDDLLKVVQEIMNGTEVDKIDQRYIDVINALKERQNAPAFDALKKQIENGKQICEINNYGDILTSYFTEKQIAELIDLYEKNNPGIILKVVTKDSKSAIANSVRINEIALASRMYFTPDGRMTKDVREIVVEKGAVKGSGYSSTQLTLTQDLNGSVGYGEFQIRGSVLNEFADVEHIPYDIRQGKITGKDIEYGEIYQTIKTMSDDSFKAYNEYLTKVYEYLRLIELGIYPPKTEIPSLDVGSLKYNDGTLIDDKILEKLSYKGLLQYGH